MLPRARPDPGSEGQQYFNHAVNGDAVILGSSSTSALSSVGREQSDVSEISSRQYSAGRLRSPTKQVTLPTVKRREQAREAWGDMENGDTARPGSSSMNGTVNGNRDGDEDEDSSSSEEEEERRAPVQLRMEFLESLMKKEYPDALKLCKMILIYEPKNPEANSFLPLIEEKIELDERPSSDEEGGESGDEEEDESDSDDDEDDDSEDSDDSDDEEDESDDEQETLVRAILKSRLSDP